MRNGGETVVDWNLALDQNGGPHQGGCSDRCNGVVEIANGNVTRNAEYYVLGHVAKFVKPGATRIGSTSQGNGGVENVAFQNPDGTRAAYVVNSATSAQKFSLTDNGKSLVYTLPMRRGRHLRVERHGRRHDRAARGLHRLVRLVPGQEHQQRCLPGRRRLGHRRRDRHAAVELHHRRQPELAVPEHR